METVDLLRKLKDKFKTDALMCKVAGIDISTLWRIRHKPGYAMRPKTKDKLVKALTAVN